MEVKDISLFAEDLAAGAQIEDTRQVPLALTFTRKRPFSRVIPWRDWEGFDRLVRCAKKLVRLLDNDIAARRNVDAGELSARQLDDFPAAETKAVRHENRVLERGAVDKWRQRRERRIAHRFSELANGLVVALAILIDPIDRRPGNDVVELI